MTLDYLKYAEALATDLEGANQPVSSRVVTKLLEERKQLLEALKAILLPRGIRLNLDCVMTEDRNAYELGYAAIANAERDAACSKCGQVDNGQTGEYPCEQCGLPTSWDAKPVLQDEMLAILKNIRKSFPDEYLIDKPYRCEVDGFELSQLDALIRKVEGGAV